MKHLFGRLIGRSRTNQKENNETSVKALTLTKPGMVERVFETAIEEADLDYLQSIMKSDRFRIDMPAIWCPDTDWYLYRVDPEDEESVEGFEEPAVFLTSLQEMLAKHLQLCRQTSHYNEGLAKIAEALRELAAEIDKTLYQDAKERRSRDNVVKLV